MEQIMENQIPCLLVNLPPTFFTHPMLKEHLARLESLAEVRKTSHNTAGEILPDLAWAQAVIMWAWPGLTDEMLADDYEAHLEGRERLYTVTERMLTSFPA
jgi:hypothetical protein